MLKITNPKDRRLSKTIKCTVAQAKKITATYEAAGFEVISVFKNEN